MKKKLTKKQRKKDFLCHWDFCSSCISYRLMNDIKMPKLRPHNYKVKGKIYE